MNKLDDDMLMAFVDGQLDEAGRRAVESSVSSNPELRKKLLVFELTREPLARAFDSVLHQPERPDLLRLVRAETNLNAGRFEEKQATPEPSGILGIFRRIFQPALGGPIAVLLSLLILFGTVAAWLLSNRLFVERVSPFNLVAYENDRLIAQGDLEHTLETVPSGTPSEQKDSATKRPLIKPILTFQDVETRYCREYEVLYQGVQRFGGVACRTKNGRWQVLVHIEESTELPTKKKFRPAAARKTPVLDNVINRIMGSNALDAAEEGNLLKNGWVHPSNHQ